jgi:hypothetical protein
MTLADLWETVAPEHFQKERYELQLGDDEFWRVWDHQEKKFLTPPLCADEAEPLVKIVKRANEKGLLDPDALQRSQATIQEAAMPPKKEPVLRPMPGWFR